MPEDEDILVLVHDALAAPAAFESPWLPIVHPPVPVGQHVLGELGVEVNHADAEVGSEEVEVVGDGPHHDEVNVLVAQLPGDCPGSAGDGVLIVDGDDDLSVRREDLELSQIR